MSLGFSTSWLVQYGVSPAFLALDKMRTGVSFRFPGSLPALLGTPPAFSAHGKIQFSVSLRFLAGQVSNY